MTEIEDLVDRIGGDSHRGAAELTRLAAEAFAGLLGRAAELDDLRRDVRGLAAALAEAQPAMAPIRLLAAAAVGAIERVPPGASADELGERVGADIDQIAARVKSGPRCVARRARPLLESAGSVLTLSSSSTVREALLLARPEEVICLEGRPNLEGRELARVIADAGVRCTLAVDAAIDSLLPRSGALVLGADAVGDLGVVNKIGTRVALLAAREAGVPALLLADTTKLLPRGAPQNLGGGRPTAEVWPDAPAGVRVWNRYFEASSLDLFSLVITEDGVESPADVEARRAALGG